MLGVDLKSLYDAETFTTNADDPNPTLRRIKPGRLRHLETGKGVRIGDAPERVSNLMGTPTWTGGSKYVPGEKVWTYHRIVGPKGDRTEYGSLFRFRHGKVTQIELTADMLDGG